MESFRAHLAHAEDMVGIPLMAADFDCWGDDIRASVEAAWPDIAHAVLCAYAATLHNKTSFASPIETKLFYAIHRKFTADFLNYPHSTALLLNKRLNQISEFLQGMGQPSVFDRSDVDFEIDLFFYHGGFGVELENGRFVPYPFFVAIECDGHQYHERTREQAQKDRSKDRMLKNKGIDVIRFTGSEITRFPEQCVKEIEQLLGSHLQRIKRIMDVGSNDTE